MLGELQRHIPKTLFLPDFIGEKDLMNTEPNWLLKRMGEVVIKETYKSGLSGIAFSSEVEKAAAMIKRARKSKNRFRFVAQEKIESQPSKFLVEMEKGSNTLVEVSMHKRVAVFYRLPGGELVDVIITARRNQPVHGAPDCIMVATIVE